MLPRFNQQFFSRPTSSKPHFAAPIDVRRFFHPPPNFSSFDGLPIWARGELQEHPCVLLNLIGDICTPDSLFWDYVEHGLGPKLVSVAK